MPASTPSPKPQRHSGSGGGSEFYAEAMDRRQEGTALHTFRGRRRSPPDPSLETSSQASSVLPMTLRGRSVSKEMMDASSGMRRLAEKAFIDFFSLAIQLQESTMLRR